MNLNQAKEKANHLMQHHGLIQAGWRFAWNSRKRSLGVCNFTKKVIFLSTPLTLADEEASITNTILHEIAHALVGPKKGHGPEWVRKAIEIGCDGKRCAEDVKFNDAVKGQAPYKAVCSNGHEFHMFRRPKTQKSCGKCYTRFNPNDLLVFKRI